MSKSNVFQRIGSSFRAAVRAFGDYDDQKYLDYIGGGKTKAGTRVSETGSLSISAIFQGLNFLASVVASLPRAIYRRRPDGGREKAIDHPLFDRFATKPNDSNMTAWNWVYSQIMHKYLWGRWYTYIDRQSYRDQQLVPLMPDRTWRDKNNPGVYYTRIRENDPAIPLSADNMIDIPHVTLDGHSGYGFVKFARESLGLTNALDEFAARHIGHGTHTGGIVEVEKKLDPNNRDRIIKDFNSKYAGLGNAFNTVFLDGGATFKADGSDPQKSQVLESRQFQIADAARWLNLPPHILRDLSRSTYNNMEEAGRELVVYTIQPLVTQIEAAFNVLFFDDAQRKTHYVKFDLKGLLRADVEARKDFYHTMLQDGVFNADMVLELEDMNPQPDGLGQKFMVPLNMVDKATLLEQSGEILGRSSSDERAQITADPIPGSATTRIFPAPERRSAGTRRRITNSFKRSLKSTSQGLLFDEIELLRGLASQRLSDQTTDLDEFFRDLKTAYKDMKPQLKQAFGSWLSGFAAAISAAALDEAGSDMDVTTQIDEWLDQYAETMAVRYASSSESQIRAVSIEAVNEQRSPAEAVEARIQEWQEKRVDKQVMRESYRAENAITREAWALVGVSKIRSVAYGDNCPYCSALNGAVIGISEAFIPAGDFQPAGADAPLTLTSPRKHPPYHDGCDCGIQIGL